MKKLFTIDDIMVAIVAALGYGFGETIARLSGWPDIMCVAACMALGIASETIIGKIVFSRAVQKKKKNRILTYAAILLIFLAAQYASIRWMGVSMLSYVKDQFLYVIGMPILGLILNMLIRAYRARQIRRLYGDGSKGYVFDVKKEDVEEVNGRNQPITGEYDTDLAVRTETGVYVGEKYKKTVCYLGIPYAKPPVGRLRWKAPEPLPASDGMFEAKNLGASAIQVEHKGAILKHHRQSEDCLTLNICVGAEKTEGKKPVLVLFHNGDFTFGGTADPLLYGANFVGKHQDIVFVSFNYRLGIFGFIDFSEVPGGQSCPDALNLGLLDQIAALKWIKENIASFGGNPERITVVGFDSGATSILLLAASERARGLFRKAFVFNGNLGQVYDTPEASRALARELMKETQTSTMEELLQLKTEMLKDAAQRLWRNMCAPTCDGAWIPTDVARAYRDGKASGVEFIIGFPGNERQALRSVVGDQNYEALICVAVADMKNAIDAPAADAVQKYIETRTAAANGMEAKAEIVEQWNALGIYRGAVKLHEGGSKVHLMYWNEKPLIENLGSGTVDVVAALLGNREALQMYGGVMDNDLSGILQGLLLKFICGTPLRLYHNEIQGVDAFDWKAFPRALIVSDGKLLCDGIEDRITEVKELLDFMKE